MQKQKRTKARIVLGITGSFGSGKSSVSGIFRSLKAKVIDADQLAHQCLNRGSVSYKKIVRVFGKTILDKDLLIDRKKLARIVFNDRDSLKKLNSIIHPQVVKWIKKDISLAREGIVVLDVPLLVEAGLKDLADKLIVVNIDKRQQIKRIQAKTKMSREDILRRIACQIPLRKKLRLADFVIDNSGTRQETKKQVEEIIGQLRSA
ncbi:MAG: dephospho-CoA kinase [Candidatus Omnitrophica bacterium]|nr:dephospho-CoA kinase [Candidatus Omnitrophota bacterium]MBU1869242.1 dephospho-CoA kinase [Candidatus Omnitrophota bacterium]